MFYFSALAKLRSGSMFCKPMTSAFIIEEASKEMKSMDTSKLFIFIFNSFLIPKNKKMKWPFFEQSLTCYLYDLCLGKCVPSNPKLHATCIMPKLLDLKKTTKYVFAIFLESLYSMLRK